MFIYIDRDMIKKKKNCILFVCIMCGLLLNVELKSCIFELCYFIIGFYIRKNFYCI